MQPAPVSIKPLACMEAIVKIFVDILGYLNKNICIHRTSCSDNMEDESCNLDELGCLYF